MKIWRNSERNKAERSVGKKKNSKAKFICCGYIVETVEKQINICGLGILDFKVR